MPDVRQAERTAQKSLSPVSEIQAKWCRGPSHEAPAMLPDTEEFFYFYKSGPREGKSHSWCRACHSWNGFQNSTLIDCKKILPYVLELVLRCGSREAAANYSQVACSAIYRITSYGQCTVQVATARKLLLALDARRREDRAAGHTPEALLQHRMKMADAERRMEISAETRPVPLPPPSHYFEE